MSPQRGFNPNVPPFVPGQRYAVPPPQQQQQQELPQYYQQQQQSYHGYPPQMYMGQQQGGGGNRMMYMQQQMYQQNQPHQQPSMQIGQWQQPPPNQHRVNIICYVPSASGQSYAPPPQQYYQQQQQHHQQQQQPHQQQQQPHQQRPEPVQQQQPADSWDDGADDHVSEKKEVVKKETLQKGDAAAKEPTAPKPQPKEPKPAKEDTPAEEVIKPSKIPDVNVELERTHFSSAKITRDFDGQIQMMDSDKFSDMSAIDMGKRSDDYMKVQWENEIPFGGLDIFSKKKEKIRISLPYLHQIFNIPDSIIYYITKNPSMTAYELLVKSCKYFYYKNKEGMKTAFKSSDGWTDLKNAIDEAFGY